jgi:DNA mismatch repair ATPase MutS
MAEVSLLFEKANDARRLESFSMPEFFIDLNLDQAVDAISKGRPEYALSSIYYRPLQSVEEIAYRQEVFRDIDTLGLFEPLNTFSEGMRSTRRSLSSLDKVYSTYHRKGWFLEAALDYLNAVGRLVRCLEAAGVESRAFRAFKAFLLRYSASKDFATFSAEATGIKRDLAEIHYSAVIKNLSVKVRRFDGEADYGADIDGTFRRFSQGSGKSYFAKYPDSSGLDHVQGQILECVAKLYPDLFARLVRFCASRSSFIDETIDVCEQEINFYLSWLDYIGALRKAGLDFCLPTLSASDKAIDARGVFDVALAKKVVFTTSPIVTNDFSIHGPERILVVTGPNQGGKTTFARIFGQLHHLASIGCLVPALEAKLFLFDRMFTHFEREETLKTHRGKLHEELIHVHENLEVATTRSILILNEVFTSTTLKDSLFLSRRIIAKIVQLDSLCVCVTFLDELASLGEKVVSLVCAVDPKDPSIRTFKIERRPADGLAYARSLAEKHRLTYEKLKQRIGS